MSEQNRGALDDVRMVSEASAVERAAGTVEIVAGLLQRALTALDDGSPARATMLLDRAERLLPADPAEVPEVMQSLMAEFGAQITRLRELADTHAGAAPDVAPEA